MISITRMKKKDNFIAENFFHQIQFDMLELLPTSEYSFSESDIGIILHWMDKGFNNEMNRVDNLLRKAKESGNLEYIEYAEDMASDDYYKYTNSKNIMHAGLIVVIWSKSETLFNSLKRIYESYTNPTNKKKQNFDIKVYSDFFKKNRICIQRIKGYKQVNLFRILNNSFKHNSGKFSKEKFKDVKRLLKKYDVTYSNDKEIFYEKIKIKELLFDCEVFWNEFIKRVKKKTSKYITH